MMSPWDMCSRTQGTSWHPDLGRTCGAHVLSLLGEQSCSYKAEPEYRDLDSSLDFDAAPLENLGKLLIESCISLHMCKIQNTSTKPF